MRMQEFGSEGGVGRVFGGAELRRPMGYLAGAGAGPPQPPPLAPPQIKCPRCESTNTKFCYYNNYNLSQPRHFCKSCRRYWTKGGVLRNVPVGGGCRKSKRAPSKPPPSSSPSASKPSSSSPSAAASAAAAGDKDHRLRLPSSSSRSSSDSSTLTAAADHPSRSNPSPNPFEALPQVPRIFPEPSGTFANMMSPGSGVLDLGFSHPAPAPAPLQSQQPKSAADDAIGAQQGFADQTVGMDLTPPFQGRSNGGGGLALNGLDWPGTVDPTLFDLSGAVDHWNPSHWGDTDPSLYLP